MERCLWIQCYLVKCLCRHIVLTVIHYNTDHLAAEMSLTLLITTLLRMKFSRLSPFVIIIQIDALLISAFQSKI